MDDDAVQLPAHLTLRVGATDDPVAAVVGLEAWESREKYPRLMMMPPVLGSLERVGPRAWRILDFHSTTPQMARDDLGHRFRCWARTEPGHPFAASWDITAQERAAYTAAYRRMDWEALDEIAVAGREYRIFRAEQVLRSGPEGIEPPRPTDPDPAEVGKGHRAPSRVRGFVIDPAAAVTLVDGILRLDLTALVPAGHDVPEDVRADARLASHLYPNVLVLPVHCAVAEYAKGRWAPMTAACESPQAARDSLAAYLRDFAPRLLPRLTADERARYAAAADRLDAERGHELSVGERRFRLVRVEPVVRLGPDGPELPRTSDWDPDLPVRLQEQRDREAGIRYDDENDGHGSHGHGDGGGGVVDEGESGGN
ncbi:DUF5954 family protein [Kitasatospora sp. A2-31]|uniref:DUF5954 family protein n=1 Tax=Kitasatospora sp. A2-31 TaxID=2916414 RepID=UPI001EEC5CA4|nr:DUF5954 family protein [Kitasatospora sp. A2-31]MCG6497929.1 DUF5954 family protein [Kitasatospora sp. A2-31]